jgi:hypothetical protein
MAKKAVVDPVESKPKINRVEVIDQNGRAYTNYSVENVKILIQDDGKTMKIFLESK